MGIKWVDDLGMGFRARKKDDVLFTVKKKEPRMDPETHLHRLLETTRDKKSGQRYCVVGAGHGGLAMAGHLGLMGYDVALYNRSDENLHGVRWRGGVDMAGAVEGFAPVRLATNDMAEALRGVDVIQVVTPSTAHRSLGALMAPHLRDGQLIVLNPGRTGGALEFRQVLRECHCKAQVCIGETATFLYASRATSRSSARIFRIKNQVALATLPAHFIPDALAILSGPFPQFKAGTNVWTTSMENIGAIFHPALTLLNAGWIESTKGDFDYYSQGITPTVAKILEGVDADRIAVSQSLGVHTVSAREWLYLTYDSAGKNLHEAIQRTDSYRGIKAPSNLMHRYIFEDVPMSLVPLSSIGHLRKVPTPMIDMVIQLASVAHGVDYRAQGRTVERMGIAGMSLKQLRQQVIGIDEPKPGKMKKGKRK
jgi:opine dehydrogenase